MNIFTENHQKLINSLVKHQVKFLLIGGYAVIYHGYKRTTGDMDLWLEPSNENKEKLIKVLKEFEFEKEGIDYLQKLDFSRQLAFHFWEEPERVDCLTYVSNIDFITAHNQKEIIVFEGVTIPIIHYNHLILTKISSDRLKDKADVEELQKIHNKTNDG